MARANRLIEQLLTTARTEPAEALAQFADVSLAETSRRVIAECHAEACAKSIAITFDTDTKATMQGDAGQLRALVRNLVDNAIRYTPNGGRVAISLHRAATATLMLNLEDTGPGIPEHERDNVFRRFYRCHANAQPGSGVGLAIVKNGAAQHCASVRLRDSALGGLRVDVIFPAHTATSEREAAGTAEMVA